jgi:hypothetical protein
MEESQRQEKDHKIEDRTHRADKKHKIADHANIPVLGLLHKARIQMVARNSHLRQRVEKIVHSYLTK